MMTDQQPKCPPDAPDVLRTPILDVRDLVEGGREVIIIHAGERYRLRITANDKLILTK